MRSTYLKYLPFVLIAVIPGLVLPYFLPKAIQDTPDFQINVQTILTQLVNIFPRLVVFFLIGLAFDKSKEALIAISIFLFFSILFFFSIIKLPLTILYAPISLLPYFVFGYLAFGQKRLWSWVFMLCPIYLTASFHEGSLFFNEDFNFFISMFFDQLFDGGEYLEPLKESFDLSK